MKRNKNFWSCILHKLGTPKMLRTDGQTLVRTDGRSGPSTRPAFAKATQVKYFVLNHKTYSLDNWYEVCSNHTLVFATTPSHKSLIR